MKTQFVGHNSGVTVWVCSKRLSRSESSDWLCCKTTRATPEAMTYIPHLWKNVDMGDVGAGYGGHKWHGALVYDWLDRWL